MTISSSGRAWSPSGTCGSTRVATRGGSLTFIVSKNGRAAGAGGAGGGMVATIASGVGGATAGAGSTVAGAGTETDAIGRVDGPSERTALAGVAAADSRALIAAVVAAG